MSDINYSREHTGPASSDGKKNPEDTPVTPQKEAKSRGRTPKPTQALAMVSTITKDTKDTLWHTPALVPYATIKVSSHHEYWPILSPAYKRWLMRVYYKLTSKIPSSQTVADAVNTLAGMALFDGQMHPVFTRVGKAQDGIYIDLGDPGWRAIRICPTGWDVVRSPAIHFRRSKGMLALPVPVRGGSLNELRSFINVESEEDWVLIISWLIGAFHPDGPYPIAVLHGEQGSAKSTTARLLRSLVDPNTTPLRSEPRDLRDVMIAANNSWIQGYDNLSHLQGWLSDTFCRLSTGGGLATRQLYTDEDETILDVRRPVILNGIEELATRGDLLDRAIILYLPTIPEEKRWTEAELWTEFEKARPHILGALLDAVAGAMSRVAETKLERLPRMADFALWVVAAESSLGWKSGTFLAAYETNRDEANELALEASVIAGEVIRILKDLNAREKLKESGLYDDEELAQTQTRLEGTATELFQKFEQWATKTARESKYWPKTPRNFSNALRRITTSLRSIGIEVTFFRRGKKRDRIITIRFSGDSSVRFVRQEGEEGGRETKADDRRAEGGRTTSSALSADSTTSGGAADEADDKTYTSSIQTRADTPPSPQNTPISSFSPPPKSQEEKGGKASSAPSVSSAKPTDAEKADEADDKTPDLDIFGE